MRILELVLLAPSFHHGSLQMLGCFLKVTYLLGSIGNELLYPLFLLKKEVIELIEFYKFGSFLYGYH